MADNRIKAILRGAPMALRMKPLPPNPELERLLKEGVKAVKAMSPEEFEAMLKAQRESWARQDMD